MTMTKNYPDLQLEPIDLSVAHIDWKELKLETVELNPIELEPLNL